MLEAAVPLPRACRSGRVHLVQITDHLLHRSVQRVEIQSVETGPIARAARRVVGAQPGHEILDHVIAPYPRGEALEPAQRGFGRRVAIVPAHVAVDAECVRPVRLDRHRAEGFLCDQPAREPRTDVVELVCAVARFTDQDDAGVADEVEKSVESGVAVVEGPGCRSDPARDRSVHLASRAESGCEGRKLGTVLTGARGAQRRPCSPGGRARRPRGGPRRCVAHRQPTRRRRQRPARRG